MSIREFSNQRNSLPPEPDEGVANLVVRVGEETLSLFDAVISAIRLDYEDDERRAVQMAMAHYAIKIQRVTRAALTLITFGQGQEAMSLIREQNEYVIGLNYYHKHPDQAVLYLVSEVLVKRNYARQIFDFDSEAASDPKRVEQYETLKREADEAYKTYPGLRRAKGKSAQSSSPQYIDWSEPSAKEMFADLMDGWLRERYHQQGEFDESVFLKHRDRLIERAYFFRHTFINQGKHGTAFSTSTTLDVIEDHFDLPSYQVDDPEKLAYHFISNALPALVTLRAHSAEGVEEARFQDLDKAFGEMKAALNIYDDPIPPLPPFNEMS